MSHHLDTPLAAQTGQLYLDDLYVFPGPGAGPQLRVGVRDLQDDRVGERPGIPGMTLAEPVRR